MSQALAAIARELQRDKYLAFLLVVILLWAFLHTKNSDLLQLLVVAVGILGGLMRSGAQTQNIASGEGSSVKSEPGAQAEVKA